MDQRVIRTEHLEVVLKLTERCNINCSYCYVFNLGNDDYKEQATVLSVATAKEVAKFLAKGVEECQVKKVTIVFHGGEPLLIKKGRFIEICDLLSQSLSSKVILRFSLQTNAILVDDEWIDIFERFQVSVGVSLDGPERFHDVYRLDHKGQGTYDKTVLGLNRIRSAYDARRIPGLGALAVVSHEFDGGEVYRHLVHDHQFTHINFLLPMDTHDQFDPNFSDKYSKYICDAFDQWVKDDNPKIHVRLFDQLLRFLTSSGLTENMRPRGSSFSEGVHISASGDLGDDELKPTNFAQLVANVRSISLHEYLNTPALLYTYEIKSSIPTLCTDCCWRAYCLGGGKNGIYSSRYSEALGFDNPSTICASLKSIYSHVASYILNQGLDINVLERLLLADTSDFLPASKLPQVSAVKRSVVPLKQISIAAEPHA